MRAKLIFILVSAAVLLLLIISFTYAARAKAARDAALIELEALRQDNAKLTQWLDERTQEVEALKKQIQKLQNTKKAKPPSQKKKTTTSRKPASSQRQR